MFWQSSQEWKRSRTRQCSPLKSGSQRRRFRRIRIDTFTGMAVSNILDQQGLNAPDGGAVEWFVVKMSLVL